LERGMDQPLREPGLPLEAEAIRERTETRRGPVVGPVVGRLLPPTLALAAVVAVWELWTRLADVPVYIVPAPSVVGSKLLSEPGYFAGHAASTLVVAMGGFALGTAVAVLYAALMSQSQLLERALYPLALLVKVVPVLVWGVLFVVWFGFGPTPKVLIAALITFFPVLVNALAGLRAANTEYLDLFRSLNASRAQVFWKLRAPGSLPYLFAAFRIAIPLAVIGAFVAEYFTGDRGIGSIISVAHSNLDMPTLYSAVIVLAAMGVALTAVTSELERRVLFWHDPFR
jgi:NitT/TauT family transport system permease protein